MVLFTLEIDVLVDVVDIAVDIVDIAVYVEDIVDVTVSVEFDCAITVG